MPTPQPPTLPELQAALRKVAKLVQHDLIFLPIFERLEREIKLAEKQNSVMDRVRALAA